MHTFSTKQVGVWLDQSKAYLIGMQKGNAFLIEIVESKIPGFIRAEEIKNIQTRFTTNSQWSFTNELKKNQIKIIELKNYFKKLQNRLQDFDDILIIGPGIVKDQFFRELLMNNVFLGKCIQAQTKGKFSENQLMTYINDFFNP